MLPFSALILLAVGGLLEVGGTAFTGLDLLIGLCFGGALVLGAMSALRARLAPASLIAAGLGALALGLHLAVHLGLLG